MLGMSHMLAHWRLNPPRQSGAPVFDADIFVDRDPEHFAAILKFLRTGRARMPRNSGDSDDLLDELHASDAHSPTPRTAAQNRPDAPRRASTHTCHAPMHSTNRLRQKERG